MSDVSQAEQHELKLIGHRLEKVEFSSDSAAVAGEISMENSNLISTVEILRSKAQLAVTLTFSVEAKQAEQSLFRLIATYRGQFAYSASLKEENLQKFVTANAPAIVYPYLRGAVAMLTVASGYPALTLPIINFHKIKTTVTEA